MSQEQREQRGDLGVLETLQKKRQKFESEVIEPTKRAMEKAIAQATSKKDAEQRIRDVLPRSFFFLGPMVIYKEVNEGERRRREIFAQIQTLDVEQWPIDIEVHFVE